MQNKIGEHIVNIAVAILGLGFTASIIIFLILILQDIDNFGKALLIGGLGCLGSWVSFLFLAGFGLIISNTTQTVELLTQIQTAFKFSDSPQKATPVTTVSEIKAGDDEKKERCEIKRREKPTVFVSPFHELLYNTGLPEEKIDEVLKLKQAKDDGELPNSNCRKQVYKIIEDLSIDKVIKVLNKL